ncbi:MAG: class I SAM-dependent methyltransferase [Porticoccaceae bacterium]
MSDPAEIAKLQAMAAQLAHPSGEAGTAIAANMNVANARIAEHAIAALAIVPGQSVVEIGPGNGRLSMDLVRQLGEGGHYTAIELSPDMARECRANLDGLSACTVTVVNTDCRATALPPESVDAIFGTNFVYFIDDLTGFLQLAYHWLKPGGRLVIGIRSKTAMAALPFTTFGFCLRESSEIVAAMTAQGWHEIRDDYHDDEGEREINGLVVKVDAHIVSGKKYSWE